jgi:dTDP-4-dehydrorhamnose reductase
MRIFIAGASGLVGSNCYNHFTAEGMNVLGSYFSYPTKNTVYFNTLDIHDTANADLAAFRPDIIVHCGALTHVDYCEDHVEESYNKTVVSTTNLLEIAKQYGAKLVYISTDYVFDGMHGPYEEEAKTNPLSVYAKHKLEAEKMTLAANKENLVLRVTNVYGNEERNKNFVSRIIGQCLNAQKLTLKLPQDQYATPVNAWDIARAMCLLLKDEHAGIFHIASTDWMNRVELALNVLKYFPDAKYNMQPMQTTEMQQAANRPLRGGLLKHKFSSLYPTFLFSNVDSFVQEFLQDRTL